MRGEGEHSADRSRGGTEIVDVQQIVSFLENNAWVTVLETHALIFGAIFLAAGFFLGLLNRGFAYLVLALGGFSTGSVILGQIGASQNLTSTAVVVAVSLVSAYALYRMARLLLLPLEFLVFLAAWFLLLYSAYGFAFTTNLSTVALWLVGSFASLFVTQRASFLLFKSHPGWKRTVAPTPPTK